MSWMQRPAGDPAARYHATQPPASAAQGYGNEHNMYPKYTTNVANPQQQEQQWQMQQQQPQQLQPAQYTQHQYPLQDNANQLYPHYNHTYNETQQGYHQNYYQNQQQHVQQNFGQPPKDNNWDDNWDWGWEESAKQAQQQAKNQQVHANQQQQPSMPYVGLQSQPQQQKPYDNANVIEESFASTDTWNWSMEDKKVSATGAQPASNPPLSQQQSSASTLLPSASPLVGADSVSEPTNQQSSSNPSAPGITEEIRTLNDKDIVKEHLPNLALGKRVHLENLTPQWSIESQMSQESSDGVQTHSESTYLSENQSRNSNSSPVQSPEHYNSHSGFEESPNVDWSRQSTEETLIDTARNIMPDDEEDEDVRNSLQELSLANREHSTLDSIHPNQDEAKNVPLQHPLGSSGPPLLPPPPVSAGLHPQPPSSSNANLPPSGPQNPFKNAGPFSHKSIAKNSTNIPTSNQMPPKPKDVPSQSSTNLTSPAAVNKIQQGRPQMAGFTANLETTPDNSERPDQPQVASFRPSVAPSQLPDNMEVAPQNDRNEYLQTAHLSTGDYGENTNFSRNIPPPGLRRMVVGQQESEYVQNMNMSRDEPPPGLSRMVPGQQTEADNSYNLPNDSYMDRHIDGQPTDNSARSYRQTADGQQTADFNQGPNRSSRPVGMDRMVPGEPSNEQYPQYPTPNFNTNDQRVVTGVDHEYGTGPPDIRDQNMDGSDYTEHTPRNTRNIPRPTREPATAEGPVEDQQREITMEGENLQDLSVISSTDLPFPREQTLDGADVNVTDAKADLNSDAPVSLEVGASNSRRQSLNRTSGEDSERDRTRDRRDKHKSSRERERDGRYSRDSKKEREGERRGDRDRHSPGEQRARRSTRSRRYDTEDTDYYSDKERDRRRYREGSSKPPRPDDKERRHRDDRDRGRRYNTIERDRAYGDERDGTTARPRTSERDGTSTRPRTSERDKDRYQRRYRDIDPTRKYGNVRRGWDEEDRRRGDASPPSRSGSREGPTDEELTDAAESRRRHRRHKHAARHDPHYDAYGTEYADPYAAQRRQYAYYEHLRLTDPAAYMLVYKKLMAGEAPYAPPTFYADPYSSLGYEGVMGAGGGAGGAGGSHNMSLHSGRSSANNLTGKDTYYCETREARRGGVAGDATSLRTDFSDRELTTDASLNLQLDESTVRSERMTPFKFSTAHVKGSISSHHVVLVRPVYPVDGLPATVQLLPLGAALQRDPHTLQLSRYPGPLVNGVTHKKSVIEYCAVRVREATRGGGGGGGAALARRDLVGYVLVWELLKLMLTQNGMVVGSDIAELLMKNQRDYQLSSGSTRARHDPGSRRGSSERSRDRAVDAPSPPPPPPAPAPTAGDRTRVEEDEPGAAPEPAAAAADRLLEYLIAGNRQEAIECAMSNGMWGDALHLSAHVSRRARAAVLQRFLAHIPTSSPLHTLYTSLAGQTPPAATCVSEPRWGDWRPHVAILLSNSGAKPEHEQKTLIQLGDSLNSRGLLYSAQFCYLSAGVPFSPHPLAPLTPPQPAPVTPPRLSLLLADPKANTLASFAHNEAIFATEIYEYAMSLHGEFSLPELQVYKFVMASRLVDAGEHGRALAYTERVARAITASPHRHVALVPRVAELADRLKYHEPQLSDEEGPAPLEDSPPSPPRHRQWQDDIQSLAHALTSEAASAQSTPQHALYTPQHAELAPHQLAAPPPPPAPPSHQQQWGGDTAQMLESSPAPAPAPAPGYQQYYQPPAPPPAQTEPQQYSYQEDWYRGGAEETGAAAGGNVSYDPYWQPDHTYTEEPAGQGEGGVEEPRPTITMPGAAAAPAARPTLYTDYEDEPARTEKETETSMSAGASRTDDSKQGKDEGGKGGQKSGWLGGILTKLSLRPPNQMILPDDKNPTIVWDPERKRWRNTDGGGGEGEEERAPPPPPRINMQQPMNSATSAPAHSGVQPPGPAAGGALPPVSNIFKMQKGRHIKKSYVDVFNPSGAPSPAPPPAAELLPPAPAPLSAARPYFVPPSAPGQQMPLPSLSTRSSFHSVTSSTSISAGAEYTEEPRSRSHWAH